MPFGLAPRALTLILVSAVQEDSNSGLPVPTGLLPSTRESAHRQTRWARILRLSILSAACYRMACASITTPCVSVCAMQKATKRGALHFSPQGPMSAPARGYLVRRRRGVNTPLQLPSTPLPLSPVYASNPTCRASRAVELWVPRSKVQKQSATLAVLRRSCDVTPQHRPSLTFSSLTRSQATSTTSQLTHSLTHEDHKLSRHLPRKEVGRGARGARSPEFAWLQSMSLSSGWLHMARQKPPQAALGTLTGDAPACPPARCAGSPRMLLAPLMLPRGMRTCA